MAGKEEHSEKVQQLMSNPKNISLDVFELFSSDKDENITAVSNPALRKSLKEILSNEKDKSKTSWKSLANSLDTDYLALWDYMNRSAGIPIGFLKKVCRGEKEMKISQNDIEFLAYGKMSGYKKIRVPKEISEDMVRIAGAIIADGYLSSKQTKFPNGKIAESTNIVIREGKKDAVELCCKWFNNVFGLSLKPKMGKNHWFISFRNKLVLRYFTNVFGIPVGKKSRIVEVPKIIFGNRSFEKEFLKSVFLFDGGVDQRTGYVDFCMMSGSLIKSMAKILTEFGVAPDFLSSQADRNGWKIRIRKKEKLRAFLEKFCIEGTTKHSKLNFHLNRQREDLNSSRNKLQELFSDTQRSSSTGFEKVIRAVENLENSGTETSLVEIQKAINKGKNVTYEYLKRLEDFGILKTERKLDYKIWRLNKNISDNMAGKEEHSEKVQQLMSNPKNIRNIGIVAHNS